jgi:hypothetical protein
LPYLEDPKEEEEQWWWRLEPILGTFRTAYQTYLIPGTGVAIDEIVSAVGTTKPSGIDFPVLLILLRKNWPTELDWGTTIADVVNSVLCIS